MMTPLPHDVIEKIFGFLPLENKESFRNYSLVEKSWVYPSQKRMFKSVETRDKNLRAWLDRVSPEHLGYVQHLICRSEPLLFTERRTERMRAASHYHNPSLQLTHFELSHTEIGSSLGEIDLFSVIGPTLSRITLMDCKLSNSALVALVNHFPNLDYICLKKLHALASHTQPSLIPRKPLKKLVIDNRFEYFPDFLEELSKLQFEEVAIESPLPTVKFVNHVARIFGAHVKCLRLPQIWRGKCNLSYSYHFEGSLIITLP
jgi:hypothetical protein